MHRPGYKGRKFGRENDQRQALIRGLICALIQHQEIETTLEKAKEMRRFAEKIITRARKGGLFSRRLVIARLGNLEVAELLIDQIAPQIKRDSGYLRITRTKLRRGDSAQMARIGFVDEFKFEAVKPVEKPVKVDKQPVSVKKAPVEAEIVAKKETK
jgi:large subunit ribosomal protein L17